MDTFSISPKAKSVCFPSRALTATYDVFSGHSKMEIISTICGDVRTIKNDTEVL